MCKNTDLARYPLVTQLAFGSVDYCADLGCARSELLLASCLAGIAPPLDGVTTDLTDPGVLAEDACHARQLGMGDKMCIPPAQVAAVRMALHPTDAEVDWARRVMAAGDGAVTLDGEMVDTPVRLRAAAVLRSLSTGEPR
ncbi:hypothetical protein [Rhodovulum sulfidophilum]|uniref:HpcH/HpaI aldolase/citrate lyase domain-containing protein n=1 Tax=Rhodovulum sulfidophilum TaxID=35806 RepID=A0ABS1RTF2_RHOSU|nr:hypothetical protein [Rhodovulum sulfidophilum]MBL3609362.1 hypothetical protein [Rhodovulum sulfidophilum]MCE8456357.1 hypothetical protein [Rhodovulum sulfidophilum]